MSRLAALDVSTPEMGNKGETKRKGQRSEKGGVRHPRCASQGRREDSRAQTTELILVWVGGEREGWGGASY